jgi:hypothetical protein
MNVKQIMETELTPDQSVMATMNESGDTKLIWDRTKKLEVEIALEAFNKAKKAGYMAYSVEGEDARKGKILHEFDPKAERVILAPPMQGG